MRCESIRTAVSAELDGEDPGIPRAVVDAHLFTCPGCREFEADARRVHGRFRVAAAAPVPDLTAAVMRAVGEEHPAAADRRDERVLLLRWCLALVALVQLGMAVPALVLGDDAGIPTHIARHLGSFTVALAAGLLVVAWQPRRAAALLPVVGVLVACLVGTSTADLVLGHAVAGAEVAHVPELAGLVAVWCLARWTPGPDPGPRRPPIGVGARP
jgi:predicted anti-sigma-YlaC factor YlaD